MVFFSLLLAWYRQESISSRTRLVLFIDFKPLLKPGRRVQPIIGLLFSRCTGTTHMSVPPPRLLPGFTHTLPMLSVNHYSPLPVRYSSSELH